MNKAKELLDELQCLDEEIQNRIDELANLEASLLSSPKIKANKVSGGQQQKIDEQGNAIQTLASSIGTPLDSKGNTKRNWMNVAIAVGVCGSFIMLLAMLCVQVFDIKI